MYKCFQAAVLIKIKVLMGKWICDYAPPKNTQKMSKGMCIQWWWGSGGGGGCRGGWGWWEDVVLGFLALTLSFSFQTEPMVLIMLNLVQGWGKPSVWKPSIKEEWLWRYFMNGNNRCVWKRAVVQQESNFPDVVTESLSLPTTTSPHHQGSHPLV